jgi:uncharacterized PurR-regulated membrane protein YhhQ (DUF165 family)
MRPLLWSRVWTARATSSVVSTFVFFPHAATDPPTIRKNASLFIAATVAQIR